MHHRFLGKYFRKKCVLFTRQDGSRIRWRLMVSAVIVCYVFYWTLCKNLYRKDFLNRIFSFTFRRIRKLINIYSTSTNTELQQRSVEYTSLFGSHDSMRLVWSELFLFSKISSSSQKLLTGDDIWTILLHISDKLQRNHSYWYFWAELDC